jgi:hypothetical protein
MAGVKDMQNLPYTLMSELERVEANGNPPVHLWHPDVEKDIDLVIQADGQWIYEGSPITRPRLVRLFASVLRKDDDGYCLVTPVEKCRIQVEDAPFQGVLLDVEGQGDDQKLVLTTDMGEKYVISQDHPLRMEIRGEQWIPYVLVRNDMEARLNRNVYYQLTDLMVETTDPKSGALCHGIVSDSSFFPMIRE